MLGFNFIVFHAYWWQKALNISTMFPTMIYKWYGLQSIFIHTHISNFIICKLGELSHKNIAKEVKYIGPNSHENFHIHLLQELQISQMIHLTAFIGRSSSFLPTGLTFVCLFVGLLFPRFDCKPVQFRPYFHLNRKNHITIFYLEKE